VFFTGEGSWLDEGICRRMKSGRGVKNWEKDESLVGSLRVGKRMGNLMHELIVRGVSNAVGTQCAIWG
jgi:hypothetical protein